jgi:large-conductance mechanosensitive channel
MGFFSDFRASLMKGDVLSLATAVYGGAFGKIINSLVEDVIMPIVGLLTGGVDFTQNSLHWMVVIMILWMPLKKGLPLSPMVIYCRRLLILLLLHCLFCDLKSG